MSDESVYDKLQRNAYENKLKIAPKPHRVAVPPALKPYLRDEYETDLASQEAEYKRSRGAYCAEDGRLAAEFKRDLEVEYATMDNPKRDLLYSKAYDHGHSSGWSEIANCYSDLVDLINP